MGQKENGGPDTPNRRLFGTVRGRRQTIRMTTCRG